MFNAWIAAVLLAAPTDQPRIVTSAPGTPHRGGFDVVHVVRTRPNARVLSSRPIEVPRNTIYPERSPPPEPEPTTDPYIFEGRDYYAYARGLAPDRLPPWQTDAGDLLERYYPIDKRFDGWAYGWYYNKVTKRYERGWHTVRFGLDPDLYR